MHLNTWGFALRRIKRAIVSTLAVGDLDRKAEWAKRLWRRHIARAAKFGVRTEDQIAWDNFVAPHLTATMGEWLQWMKQNGMDYVSSFPSFYSLKLPSAKTGGIDNFQCPPPPSLAITRWLLRGVVQLRWAFAFRVGGLCSISYVARKRLQDNV